MEVILKEDVPKLGSRGDVVKVAEGYGRNFLLPRKLAIGATPPQQAGEDTRKTKLTRKRSLANSPAFRSSSSAAPASTISSSARSRRVKSPRSSRKRAS